MADDDKAASARAKAEARRQRILAASGERMGVVSGGTEGQTGASDPTGTTAGGDASAPGEGGSGGGGMSKYAAARRRRYGNKKAAAASAPAPAAEDEAAAKEPAAASSAATEEKPEPKAESEETTKSDQKKYMGVAKMRRMKLAERKKAAEEGGIGSDAAGGSSASLGSTGTSASGRKLGVPKSLSTVARETVKRHRLAVLMQLFTLALLFLAGLGVGMKNHAHNDGAVVISERLSLGENGFGALRILGLGGGGSGGETDAAKEARERLLEEAEEKVQVAAEGGDKETAGEDEFGDVNAATGGGDDDATDADATKPKGVGGDDGSSDKVPNIDPLFRVDLDELTAGPGILNVAGRVAVKFHRSIMYLILVLPLSILQSILALPRALMTNPPVLFLLTIVIRYLGRDILGARLPDLSEAAGADGGEDSKDMISSVKNMVTNYMSASFPNAAKFMEVMRDARQDMFVILCGLFVGLILPIHLGKEAGKDEL